MNLIRKIKNRLFIRKCKKDTVFFVENVLGMNLTPSQKIIAKEVNKIILNRRAYNDKRRNFKAS